MLTHSTSKQKRNITLPTRRTSVALDEYYWQSIDRITDRESISLNQLIHEIDLRRGRQSLAESCRLFATMYSDCLIEAQAAQDGSGNPYSDQKDDQHIAMVAEPGGTRPTILLRAFMKLSQACA